MPALDAVLADLERIQPDLVVVAGDFVNRGPQSRAILERIAPYRFPAISGNHDTWLVTLSRGERIPEDWADSWWTPVRLATRDITPEWRAWLDTLPFSRRVELPGAEPALIVHGSPRHAREGMGRLVGDARLAEALASVEERTVIGAHIHYPYERRVMAGGAERHVVVVSAVGMPFNGDTRAQYGLFTWDDATRAWRFEPRAVAYDQAPLFAAWRANGYLDDDSLASELLMREHLTARTYYTPFWEWCVERERPLDRASFAAFAAERGEPAALPPLPDSSTLA